MSNIGTGTGTGTGTGVALPRHIAIIMDGNGRWAEMRGRSRLEGHAEGALSVRDIVTASREIGIEALELVHDRRPDLVLLDLNMPEMDGRRFLDTVRGDPALASMHVVVLSGAADAPRLPCESVSKPLRLDTLLGLIDRVARSAS